MRSSVFFAVPFLAAAYAQSSSEANSTVVDISSGSTTVQTTVPYTNGFTSFLTQTNSLGVVTGMPAVDTAQSALPPAVTTQPGAVTTQPAVATIPAGLPEGTTYLLMNISRSLTSFEVSVGSSTTVVINGPESATIVTGTGTETGAAASSGTGSASSGSSGSGSGASTTRGSSTSGTASGSAASSTGNADSGADRITLASAGVLGFGALVAAFL